MDEYPETHMQVYQYIFYMTCPDPDLNPFLIYLNTKKKILLLKKSN